MKNFVLLIALVLVSLISTRWISQLAAARSTTRVLNAAEAFPINSDMGLCYDHFNDCTGTFTLTDYGNCQVRNEFSFFDQVDNKCYDLH